MRRTGMGMGTNTKSVESVFPKRGGGKEAVKPQKNNWGSRGGTQPTQVCTKNEVSTEKKS